MMDTFKGFPSVLEKKKKRADNKAKGMRCQNENQLSDVIFCSLAPIR